jgi:hypothetical protein
MKYRRELAQLRVTCCILKTLTIWAKVPGETSSGIVGFGLIFLTDYHQREFHGPAKQIDVLRALRDPSTVALGQIISQRVGGLLTSKLISSSRKSEDLSDLYRHVRQEVPYTWLP